MTLGYNPAGQITGETPASAAYTFAGRYDVARGYAVNGQDQYDTAGALSLSYDANGNLIADGRRRYVYDAENRLVRAGEVSLRYDPLGRLAALTGGGVERAFLYDGDALVAEYGAGGGLRDAYVHGPGADEPLLWYHAGGAARWLHRDHEGSIVAVTAGGSGLLRRILRYDEHGIPGAGNIGRFQFTGQAWLRELGLYHYKARAYSPTLGRFLQTDPVGYRDQLNLYEYVGDDPVNKRDPSGESITELGFLAVDVAETAAHVATGASAGTLLNDAANIALDVAPVPGVREVKAAVELGRAVEHAAEAARASRFASKAEKAALFERAGGKCEYCGREITREPGHANSMHADHIAAHAKGGKTEEGNLAASCRTCNLTKGAKEIGTEAGSGKFVPSKPNERIEDYLRKLGQGR